MKCRFGCILKRPVPLGIKDELITMMNRYGGFLGEDAHLFLKGKNQTYITSDGTMWDYKTACADINNRNEDGCSIF